MHRNGLMHRSAPFQTASTVHPEWSFARHSHQGGEINASMLEDIHLFPQPKHPAGQYGLPRAATAFLTRVTEYHKSKLPFDTRGSAPAAPWLLVGLESLQLKEDRLHHWAAQLLAFLRVCVRKRHEDGLMDV